MLVRRCRALLALLALVACGANALEDARAISVRDVVGFTHVDVAGESTVSPDKRWFYVLTWRGELDRGVNTYTVSVYGVQEALRAIRGGADLKELKVHASATLASDSNRPGIRQLAWSRDSRRLTFLGEQASAFPQVFVLDVEAGTTRQLSSASSEITSYSGAAGRVAYYGIVELSPPSRSKAGAFVVGDESLMDLVTGKRSPGSPTYQLYLEDRGGARPIPLPPLKAHPSPWNNGIWMSPDGRHVVFSRTVEKIPPHWLRYSSFVRRQAVTPPTAADPNPSLIPQYVVYDVRAGQVLAAIDAPTGFYGMPVRSTIQWRSDGGSFLLLNTRLPLEGVDPAEAERRARTAAIAEFDIATTRLTPIDYFELPPDLLRRRRVTAFEVIGDDAFVAVWTETDGRRTRDLYRKSDGRWAKQGASDGAGQPLIVDVLQDLDTPPEVFVSDPASGKRAQLTDLNPGIRKLARGKVSVFKWKDSKGGEWRGGLVLPPGHQAGRRLPLVLQTHGFDPNAYLLEGPDSTGEAAQPLASAGFAVLLIGDRHEVLQQDDEAQQYMEAYEAAVTELDRMGLVDPGNVAITGFSRTYYHALHAAAFSKLRFAAVNLSDGVDFGYANYLLSLNDSAGELYRLAYIAKNGGKPTGDGIRAWLQRSPVFNTHRIKAPVRIETTRRRGVIYRWELYSRLKLEGKPVELFVIEDGVHSLVQPRHREATMQGMVDWFCFWMRNGECMDASNAEQVARWRKLRE